MATRMVRRNHPQNAWNDGTDTEKVLEELKDVLASVRDEFVLLRSDVERCLSELATIREQLMKLGIPNQWP